MTATLAPTAPAQDRIAALEDVSADDLRALLGEVIAAAALTVDDLPLDRFDRGAASSARRTLSIVDRHLGVDGGSL